MLIQVKTNAIIKLGKTSFYLKKEKIKNENGLY